MAPPIARASTNDGPVYSAGSLMGKVIRTSVHAVVTPTRTESGKDVGTVTTIIDAV